MRPGDRALLSVLFSRIKNPHITISCAKGVKPQYSIGLLKQSAHTAVSSMDLMPRFGVLDGDSGCIYFGTENEE